MNNLLLTADVQLTAAAESGKPPRVSILAYAGGLIRPPGWGNVITEISGLEIPASVPLLAEHDASLRGVIGGGSPRKDSGKLYVEGTLADTEPSRQIIALHRANVPLSASVGVEPLQFKRLNAGEKIHANGRTHVIPEGGATLVVRGRLREVSIVAIGADPAAAVSIAAKGKSMKTNPVNTEANPGVSRNGMAYDDPALEAAADDRHAVLRNAPPDVVEAAVGHERERVRQVMAVCSGDWGPHARRVDLLRAQAIGGEISLPTLRAELLEIHKAQMPKGPVIRASAYEGGSRESLEACLLIRAGLESVAVKAYGEQTTEGARRIRANSFPDLCAAALMLDGRDVGGMSRQEMIKAGFSGVNLPNILSNVTGRALFEAYRVAPATWRSFAKIMPAADFKPQKGIRGSFVGQLEELPPTGEIKHAVVEEEGVYSWKIATFAKTLKLTRHDVIDDDLGFISETAPSMAKMAIRTLNDLVWKTILANAGNFFSAGNGNLLEAGSALALGSLASAVSALRSQRDSKGNDIDIMPKVLAVPPELEVTARNILNSELVQAAEGDPMGNALRNIAALEVESRLSNTDKFAGASATAWHLFAGPQDAPIIVGFLEGQEAPTVEFFGLDADPDHLGVQWRVYHDFGCALGDYRAAVKATGAA